MYAVFCVLILNYLVTTQAILKSNSVNLALETVLEFDNESLKSDVQIIDNVQKFLTKVRSILDKSSDFRRSDTREKIKFTDFVENALIILKAFDDDDLEDLVVAVDDELRKYHYEGCKFYELVQNGDLRKYITESLEVMRATPAKQLKRDMDTLQRKLQRNSFSDQEANFIDYINSLYDGKISESMYNVLQNLQNYHAGTKHNKDDLVKVVRDAIRTVIFDHYSNLNMNARRDLRIKVATYLIDYSAKGKKFNSSVITYSTMKFDDVDGQDSHDDAKMNKILKPIIDLKNSSNVIVIDDEMITWKPGVRPEELTTKPKKQLKRKDIKRKKKITLAPTSPKPIIPMITLWEEERSKEKHRHHSKKTKMVTRKDRPLMEILSEHNAVINVKSTYYPASTTKKKLRHKHKSKNMTTPKQTKTTKAKATKKLRSHEGNTVSKEQPFEITTKIEPDRKYFDKSEDDGLSIESFVSLRRAMSKTHDYEFAKRSQKRRNAKQKLKRFSTEEDNHNQVNKVIIKSKDTTTITTSTNDSNFILNKINYIEKELGDLKHKVEVDLPLLGSLPNFKTIKIDTTSTTEHPKYKDKVVKLVSMTNNKIRNVTVPDCATSVNTTTCPFTKMVTTTFTSTKPTVSTPMTTLSSTAANKVKTVFRAVENETIVLSDLQNNDTLPKPIVDLDENDMKKEFYDTDFDINNLSNITIKCNITEVLKPADSSKEAAIKKDTKKVQMTTLSFFGLDKTIQKAGQNVKDDIAKTQINARRNLRPNNGRIIRRLGFLSPVDKCESSKESGRRSYKPKQVQFIL